MLVKTIFVKRIPVTIKYIKQIDYSAVYDDHDYYDAILVYIEDELVITMFGYEIKAYGLDKKKHMIRQWLKTRGYSRGQRRKWFSEIAKRLKKKGIIKTKRELCGIFGALSYIRELI